MDLIPVSSKADPLSLYESQMRTFLLDIYPPLIESMKWDTDLVSATPDFINIYVRRDTPIIFTGLTPLIQLELKTYWALFLSDPRMNSLSKFKRRLPAMDWIRDECNKFESLFGVSCIAEIAHPELTNFDDHGFTIGRGHNKELIEEFSKSKIISSKKGIKQIQTYSRSNELVGKEYHSPAVTIIGEIHKKIVIQREQFKPLRDRGIIYLNSIYSEKDLRFKDAQRQKDKHINLYKFPSWMRRAVTDHILDKASYGELSPSTMIGYVARLTHFRDFMHEQFPSPSPSLISETLIGENFVEWGNKKGLRGKNWFTDTIAMLSHASRTKPSTWPVIAVSPRSVKKITNTHYKLGLGRIGHNKEGAGRSYSQRIIDELNIAILDTPEPIHEIFTLILSVGMRAEDGHAILFDCLGEDPHDEDFMLLTFWQNKVRRWNTKPLHKKNKEHALLISMIEKQKRRVIEAHWKPTKYLFPTLNGSHESFISPQYTSSQIKIASIKHGILSDKGEKLKFSWHPLRHTKGTSLAADGHDILSIMMELGHASPDMAMVYINNRLELKKRALMENGGGRFYTIEGKVDDCVANLLVRKDQINATRVCGGACTMPAQIGDWCEHANACYTCKHYRADAKDLDHFKNEKNAIIGLIEEQQEELIQLQQNQQTRMSEITSRRLVKNKEVYKRLNDIVSSIEADGHYKGQEQKMRKISLEDK